MVRIRSSSRSSVPSMHVPVVVLGTEVANVTGSSMTDAEKECSSICSNGERIDALDTLNRIAANCASSLCVISRVLNGKEKKNDQTLQRNSPRSASSTVPTCLRWNAGSSIALQTSRLANTLGHTRMRSDRRRRLSHLKSRAVIASEWPMRDDQTPLRRSAGRS